MTTYYTVAGHLINVKKQHRIFVSNVFQVLVPDHDGQGEAHLSLDSPSLLPLQLSPSCPKLSVGTIFAWTFGFARGDTPALEFATHLSRREGAPECPG